MSILSVFLGNEYTGTLTCDKHHLFSFHYAPEWITKRNVPPLSLSMPVREAAYDDEKARPFFTNLLPESAVREAVARKLGISPRNDFALLAALGGECAGAVTLLPQGSAPLDKYEYRELSDEQLQKIIQSLSINPLLAGEEHIRLSLAGAQEKLPVLKKNNQVYLPLESSPSSHIIKPKIPGFEDSVRNEVFCMKLAEHLGLSVPYTEIMTTPEVLYVVARFDRFYDGSGKLCRIHQEDFCQAAGLIAENKYEAEGGLSLGRCFSLIDRFSTHPALDRKKMLDWIIFNYLIHNADGHAKNLSLLLTAHEIRLAPFYDLMCTGVYEGINKKLAMKIGGENRPQWIQRRHWERLAEDIGIRAEFIMRTLHNMSAKIMQIAQNVAEEQEVKWGPASILIRIQKIISEQVKHTRSVIGT